jgi:flavin-binding protein dodecin
MAVALAFRLELRLDTRSRRYDRSDGIWPVLSRRRGSLDELRWVHIEVYETTTHVDIHGVETIGRTYEVQLVWGREHPALPWKVYRGRDYGPAAAKATELADTLGLSVAEGSLLRRIRPELGSAPYDSRLALPTKERMASVLARVRQ